MNRGLHTSLTTGILVVGVALASAASLAQQRPDLHRAEREPSGAGSEDSRATLSLERWGAEITADPRAIEVTDLQGRDISTVTRQRLVGDALRLSIPEQRQFIVRPRDVITLRLPSERTVLPGGVVQREEAGPGRHVWFRPTIGASPLPVTWDATQRRYRTGILLGLQLPPDQHDTRLERPVTMRLGFRGMTAEPVADIVLQRAGLEHEQRVALSFLPTTRSPVLELRSPLGSIDLEIDVLNRLELHPVSTRIRGLGLETVGLDVVHLLPHGVAAPVDTDIVVSLEIDGGARLETDPVRIRAGTSRERVTLRSGGLGPVTVTATAHGMTDVRTIDQTLPLLPLTAALLGGALGGFSRRFQSHAPDVAPRARILEGVAVALVAYTAAVLGVGVQVIPAAVAGTEAGAFLVGALSGFVGVAVIEALTRSAETRTG